MQKQRQPAKTQHIDCLATTSLKRRPPVKTRYKTGRVQKPISKTEGMKVNETFDSTSNNNQLFHINASEHASSNPINFTPSSGFKVWFHSIFNKKACQSLPSRCSRGISIETRSSESCTGRPTHCWFGSKGRSRTPACPAGASKLEPATQSSGLELNGAVQMNHPVCNGRHKIEKIGITAILKKALQVWRLYIT